MSHETVQIEKDDNLFWLRQRDRVRERNRDRARHIETNGETEKKVRQTDG